MEISKIETINRKRNGSIMKPFNIEKAQAGHPVITRDGKPVRIICYDAKHYEYPIVALLSHDGHNDVVEKYTKDGHYFHDHSGSVNDLFMAPQKVTKWFNVYKNETGYHWLSDLFDSKEEAVDFFLHGDKHYPRPYNCLGTHSIEIEE